MERIGEQAMDVRLLKSRLQNGGNGTRKGQKASVKPKQD